MDLARTPEPELMDDPVQARAYSEADFAAAHDAFVAHTRRVFGPIRGRVLDLGCGPADVTVRFALAHPDAEIVGVDAGPQMLGLAGERVTRLGLTDRIRFEQRHLPDPALGARRFDAVVSNSLLHHLADPGTLWSTVASCAAPGAPVAVMDLRRPCSDAELRDLAARYAGDEPDVLRHDFAASLAAAYRPDEVRSQVAAAGLVGFAVEAVSDRHLLVTGRGL